MDRDYIGYIKPPAYKVKQLDVLLQKQPPEVFCKKKLFLEI